MLKGFTITNGSGEIYSLTNTDGGGIYSSSNGSLEDLIIANNTATRYGGGIYIPSGNINAPSVIYPTAITDFAIPFIILVTAVRTI